MALNDVLTLINEEIVTNGNNEITADVLRPVLVAMVNQINDLVGDSDDLPSGSSTVIEALNVTTNTKLRNYVEVEDSYLIKEIDDVVVFTGVLTNMDAVLPAAGEAKNRILTIVNLASNQIETTEDYDNVHGQTTIKISPNKALRIISNGDKWQEISNTTTSI